MNTLTLNVLSISPLAGKTTKNPQCRVYYIQISIDQNSHMHIAHHTSYTLSNSFGSTAQKYGSTGCLSNASILIHLVNDVDERHNTTRIRKNGEEFGETTAEKKVSVINDVVCNDFALIFRIR